MCSEKVESSSRQNHSTNFLSDDGWRTVSEGVARPARRRKEKRDKQDSLVKQIHGLTSLT